MRISRMGSAWALLLGLAAFGCTSQLHDENVALHTQNRELQSQLTDAQTRLRNQPDAAALQAELAARDARIQDLQKSQGEGSRQASALSGNPLAGMDVTRNQAAGTMTVNVPDDVLFEPGRAMLGEPSKATLDKIVVALKHEYLGRTVRIDGYTDSDPIVHSHWKSNLELSEARAKAVATYLISRGVAKDLVTIRGCGDKNPRSTDKAVNRRVEIVVFTR